MPLINIVLKKWLGNGNDLTIVKFDHFGDTVFTWKILDNTGKMQENTGNLILT